MATPAAPDQGLGPGPGPVLARVWFVRHGQSAANAGAVTFDPAEIPLTALGLAQAARLADRAGVEPAPPALVVTSPFLRARQTAAPLAARFPGVPLKTWPVQEFTYLNPGACVGTDWRARRPRVEAYWARADAAFRDGDGAESFADLLARARASVARLAAWARARPPLPAPGAAAVTAAVPWVVVFSHGQFIQALRLLGLDRALAEPQALIGLFRPLDALSPIPNASVLPALLGAEGRLWLGPLWHPAA